jgi:hypothetical protein
MGHTIVTYTAKPGREGERRARAVFEARTNTTRRIPLRGLPPPDARQFMHI